MAVAAPRAPRRSLQDLMAELTACNLNTDVGPREEIRMVLIGKTGSGKSASGNTILRRKAFQSALSPGSVTSECEKASGSVGGRRVALIDTPGIYDTKYSESEVVRKLKECISYSAPGPHVFLIVIKLDRFTPEEQATVDLLQKMFGDQAADYSMVLFTHGDQLGGTRVQDFFRKSRPLCRLIAECNGRYHVLNNKVPDDTQVPELLDKITTMIQENGGSFYTNEMFLEAELAIREEAARIMKAMAEERRREEEKLRLKYEGEQLRKELKNLEEELQGKSRQKAEKKNKFLNTGLIVVSAEVGVGIGAAAGTPGGPVCMALGAAVFGVVGAIVGVVAPAAAKSLKNKCVTQ